MNNTKSPFPIHPFLFSIHPLLHLYLNNIAFIYPENVLKLSLVLLGSTFFLLWALKLFIPPLANRAFILSVFILTFFNFTLTYKTLLLGLNPTVSALIALLIMGGLFMMATYSTLKNRLNISMLTQLFNLISITMIGLVIAPLTIYYWSFTQPGWRAVANQMVSQEVELKLDNTLNSPDIYYIIVDGYGREDVLKELYGFDNGPFLEHLSELGFVIAPKAHSNYPQTNLSLASSLNMRLLDDLGAVMGQSEDRGPLRYLIQNNSVARILRKAGYQFVFISSGYGEAIATENSPQADLCYCEENGLNGLESGLFNLTPLRLWAPQELDPYISHRHKVLNGFRYLTDLPEFDKPIFVFAHIIAPHPPFIFGPNGEEIVPPLPFSLNDASHFEGTKEEYVTGYRNQLMFINTKLEEMLETILTKSKTPPIIILQGDHGPGSMLDWENAERSNIKERFSIFAAYHLPSDIAFQVNDRDSLIPPDMTPVNTFRVVFNHYLGANLELLPNKSYISDWEMLYNFVLLTDEELH